MPVEFPARPLIFVAHPDDESLACGGLLQRVETALVVFATDGAAPGFGGERISGSLTAYSDARFLEASRALAHIMNTSFQRLAKPDGSYFVEVHLFEELPEVFACLCAVARSFSPDAIISHAYEGAHLDHDACSFIATYAASELSLKCFEFPLYWLDATGNVVRQQFRDVPPVAAGSANEAFELRLSNSEIDRKRKMLAEYHTQRGTVSSFAPGVERFRLGPSSGSFLEPQCRDYMFQERRPRFYHTRRHRLPAKALLRKFREFEDWWQRNNRTRQ